MEDPPSLEDRYTLDQAAHELGLSYRTVRRRVQTGELNVIYVKASAYITQDEIDRYRRLHPGPGRSNRLLPARELSDVEAAEVARVYSTPTDS